MTAPINSQQVFLKGSKKYIPIQIDSFKELQGDCKIIQSQFIKFSCLKTALLIVPLTITIIGLFLIKYYTKYRVKLFFTQSELEEATHIYIIGEGDSQKIQKLFKDDQEQQMSFIYRKLKYKIIDQQIVPVGLNLMRYYSAYIDQTYIKNGLDKEKYGIQMNRYGKNQHLVEAPNYFQYAFKTLTQPFFLIQYLASVIYFAQKLASLAALLLAASVLTMSLNYILLYLSYKKIKEVAEKQIEVTVIRQKKQQTILHHDLVPGDIFLVEEKMQIPCDALMLRGEAYMNQASLTGESVPIGKFPCQGVSELKDSSKWLYEGSTVLSAKRGTLLLAVNTGYRSKRGRIIRKILSKKSGMPDFFKSIIFFLCQIYLIGGIIVFFSVLHLFLAADIEVVMIVLMALLFITFCFPPAFPIYFNLAYSFCLARLKFKGINGTQPEKTIQGTNLKIMCFDKTGTLTEEKVILNKIYKFNNIVQISSKNNSNNNNKNSSNNNNTISSSSSSSSSFKQDITKELQKPDCRLIKALFSTCHTVKKFDNQYKGDEIDLKMFLYSKSQFQSCSQRQQIRCKILDNQNNQYQVLRINQYESKFQSMSVLIRDCKDKKLYAFSKGAPEKIHNFSKIKYQNNFSSLISQLSYEGLRTIAFAFKQVQANDLNYYLTVQRDTFLKNSTILGVVAFENKLKDDAIQTIQKLKQASIQSKMITGDNIYIAIQTAMRAHILNSDEEIVVIEGADNHKEKSKQAEKFNVKLVSSKNNKFHMKQAVMKKQQYLTCEKCIAVDNEFLDLGVGVDGNDKGPPLVSQIKIFSRITPENKARIVKTYKNQFKQKKQSMTQFQKLTGKPLERVGMVGDGANDLIALKQADIGMGISNSDASYASTFAINNLMDIDQILRESKATERSIIQICRFYSIGNYLNIPLITMLFIQGSFFDDFQLLFLNLTKLIILNLAYPLSRALPIPTKYKPQSNFFGLENHLVFWGNVIIYSAGYVAVYIYGRDFSGQFVPNPKPTVTFDSGYYSKTFSVTLLLLAYNIQPPTLAFFIYKSKPWKQYIFCNVIIFIIIVVNIIFGVALFFLTEELQDFLKMLPMPNNVQLTVFIIMLITVVAAFLWNLFVDYLKLHEKQFHQQQNRNSREKDDRQQQKILVTTEQGILSSSKDNIANKNSQLS